MTDEADLYYTTHIFCCINERDSDHPRGSCKARGGEEIQSYLKKRLKKLKLPKTRVNKAGCLDRCELGPVIVVYPEGIWYHCPTKADADEIIESHILSGKPVERLRLGARQKRL